MNPLASLLAVITLSSYLLLYTPLKRITPLCTLIGAVPGAMPPLIGWAAARGRLDPEAWVLFAIVFCWQFPHFMAIAWMYRDDYERAGYRVLPRGPARARWVTLQTLAPVLALLPLSLLPLAGQSAMLHQLGVFFIGIGFACYANLLRDPKVRLVGPSTADGIHPVSASTACADADDAVKHGSRI